MPSVRQNRSTKSERFLKAIAPYARCLIVTHDNPDPDAIATGWAVHTFIQERVDQEVRFVGGGAIVRAENRHMVDLLSPPIELVDRIVIEPDTATILVDGSVGATNHLLSRGRFRPVAVIDHHQMVNGRSTQSFRDVRPGVAATATIAASYLREQKIEPGDKLATALLYAVRTETRGCEFHYSRLDRSVLLWLTERADPGLLAEIESAPLPRAYFGDLVLAMQNTFVYDGAALCLLPRAEGAEIVGEVADLLIRCDEITRVFCGAAVGDDLVVSVRTKHDDDSAALLVQATLKGLGGGGGHEHRAGGKITAAARDGRIYEDLQDELRNRWLVACRIDRQRGTRLVALREIVENL